MPAIWTLDGSPLSLALLNKTLLEAAGKGDFETISRCLKNGADPNYSNCHGETAFYFAASAGHVKILKALKRAGAQTKKMTVLGRNALHAALAENREQAVQYLIREHGKEFDTVTDDGWSVAALACHFASPNITKLVLYTGYRMDHSTPKASVLHWAVLRGVPEILKLALHFGAEKNIKYKGATPLHFALDNYGLPTGKDKQSIAKLSTRLELIRILISSNCKLHCQQCKCSECSNCVNCCKCVNKQLLQYTHDLRTKRRDGLRLKGTTPNNNTNIPSKNTSVNLKKSVVSKDLPLVADVATATTAC